MASWRATAVVVVVREVVEAFWPGAYQLPGSVPTRLKVPAPYQVLSWLKAVAGIWKRGTKLALTESFPPTFSPVVFEASRSLPFVIVDALVTYSMVWSSQLELKPAEVL